MASFYVVATPIGNLKDITFRALEILKTVDIILCEDTRITKKLLNHFHIKKPTVSYHQHSRLEKINQIIGFLEQGKDLALVSDAGTPGISDPGNKLIEEIVHKASGKINIIPVPGPSAATACLSVCGFPTDNFVFLGFPPTKRKRKKFFQKVADSDIPVVFYESPHRILKSLKELQAVLGKEQKKAVVCRELTKKFESTYRGSIQEVSVLISKDKIKGEFVAIIDKNYG